VAQERVVAPQLFFDDGVQADEEELGVEEDGGVGFLGVRGTVEGCRRVSLCDGDGLEDRLFFSSSLSRTDLSRMESWNGVSSYPFITFSVKKSLLPCANWTQNLLRIASWSFLRANLDCEYAMMMVS
jgi:hypothetical protein